MASLLHTSTVGYKLSNTGLYYYLNNKSLSFAQLNTVIGNIADSICFQRFAPELVAALKRRVDRQQKPGMYLLIGSQQWQVLRSASESLAGRAVFVDLEGFCMAELASQPGNEHWLKRYLDAPEDFISNPGERISYGRSL